MTTQEFIRLAAVLAASIAAVVVWLRWTEV